MCQKPKVAEDVVRQLAKLLPRSAPASNRRRRVAYGRFTVLPGSAEGLAMLGNEGAQSAGHMDHDDENRSGVIAQPALDQLKD